MMARSAEAAISIPARWSRWTRRRAGRKWWFQFTPHDVHDWDANETPVLIDRVIDGRLRRLLVTAQRNAFYRACDRETGEFIAGRAFAEAGHLGRRGLTRRGGRSMLPDTTPTPTGNRVCPDAAGAANWGSPSYDPVSGLLLVSGSGDLRDLHQRDQKPDPGSGVYRRWG
jgi:alcohol dehydrogenase (cytochrome c)